MKSIDRSDYTKTSQFRTVFEDVFSERICFTISSFSIANFARRNKKRSLMSNDITFCIEKDMLSKKCDVSNSEEVWSYILSNWKSLVFIALQGLYKDNISVVISTTYNYVEPCLNMTEEEQLEFIKSLEIDPDNIPEVNGYYIDIREDLYTRNAKDNNGYDSNGMDNF